MIQLYNREEFILEKSSPKYLTWYILLLSVLITTIILLAIFYKYPGYKVVYGYLDQDYNLKINLEEVYLSEFDNLYLDNKKLNYQIVTISENYILDNNYNKYKELTLKIDLKEEKKIVNNVFQIKLRLKNKTLYERIKEKKG